MNNQDASLLLALYETLRGRQTSLYYIFLVWKFSRAVITLAVFFVW